MSELYYDQDAIAKLKIDDIVNIPGIVKLKHIKKCGIYFLVLNGRIMYVGQSTDIFSRIKQHNDKEFKDVFYIKYRKKILMKKSVNILLIVRLLIIKHGTMK